MALHFVRVDSLTGKLKRLVNLYQDFFFTVSGSPATEFVIVGKTINASDPIEVWRNGIDQEETTEFTRNVAGNKIVFGTAVPLNARIKVRVWY